MLKTSQPSRYPGRLIAVEGLDGAGKSTQLYLLKRWLEDQGLKVFLSEWNTSSLVKKVTQKNRRRELLTPTTFSLIHATEFADRYDRQLLPLLEAGYLVLCDRYIFNAFARDTVRGCPADWVERLYKFAVLPDLTFFLNVSLETVTDRMMSSRVPLSYFDAGMDLRLSADEYESFRLFQARLQEYYLALSQRFAFRMIDGDAPVEAQQDVIRRLTRTGIQLRKHSARGTLKV